MIVGQASKMKIGEVSRFLKFIQDVRVEAGKVTWPTRKETLLTTAMVAVLVVIASLFFLVIDGFVQKVVAFLLGIGQ
jgi:preprotein translocase subunit SecE